MDNNAYDKLEDRRCIFLRRGQMLLLASAERRSPPHSGLRSLLRRGMPVMGFHVLVFGV